MRHFLLLARIVPAAMIVLPVAWTHPAIGIVMNAAGAV
jgi:hypothetical protein